MEWLGTEATAATGNFAVSLARNHRASFKGRSSFLLFESPKIQSWCSQAVCDALSALVTIDTLPTASVLPTRYFLLCSHPTLLPPLDSTHIKSRTAKDSELVPVLTACIIVRLVYAGACEDLGRMGTLSKWWRV